MFRIDAGKTSHYCDGLSRRSFVQIGAAGMAAVGLVIGGASIGSIWLLDHWQHADLFFRVLPPAMFAVLLIYETIRLRSMHSRRTVLIETAMEIVDDK